MRTAWLDTLWTILAAAAGFVGYVLAEFGVPIPEDAPVFRLFAAAGMIAGMPLGKFVAMRASGLKRFLWLPLGGLVTFFILLCLYLVLRERGAADTSYMVLLAAVLTMSFASLSFLLAVSGSAMVPSKTSQFRWGRRKAVARRLQGRPRRAS
jgi:hypothetical protein